MTDREQYEKTSRELYELLEKTLGGPLQVGMLLGSLHLIEGDQKFKESVRLLTNMTRLGVNLQTDEEIAKEIENGQTLRETEGWPGGGDSTREENNDGET